MESSQNDLLDSPEFQCSWCKRVFTDPRLLSCGHTFCNKCLKNNLAMVKDKTKLTCPVATCKALHKFGKGENIDTLPKNHYVENIIVKIREENAKKQQVPLIYSLYSNQSQSESNYQDINSNVNYESEPLIQQTPQTSYPLPYQTPIQVPIQTQQTSMYDQHQPQTQHQPYQDVFYDNTQVPFDNNPTAPPIELNSQPAFNTNTNTTPNLYPNLTQSPPPLPPKNSNSVQQVQQQPQQQPYQQQHQQPHQQHQQPYQQPHPQSYPPQQPQQQQPQQPVQAQQDPKNQEKKTSMFGNFWNFFTGDGNSERSKQTTQSQPSAQILYAPFLSDVPGVYPHFKKWCSKWWFAPSDFDNKMKIGSCVPTYIPFWVFTMSVNTEYEAHVSYYDKDPAGRRTEKWQIQKSSQIGNYNKIVVCADLEYRAEILEFIHAVDDWNTDAATSLQPFLCGNVQPRISKSMNQKTALTRVSQIVLKKEEENCVARLKKEGYEKVEQFKVLGMNFSGILIKQVYLPLFVSNFFYEGKEYKFVMNGQTNSIQGQRPYGLGKLGNVVSSGTQMLNSLFK